MRKKDRRRMVNLRVHALCSDGQEERRLCRSCMTGALINALHVFNSVLIAVQQKSLIHYVKYNSHVCR